MKYPIAEDQLLKVGIVDGRLQITIGVNGLIHAAGSLPEYDEVEVTVTDPSAFMSSVRSALNDELEDGSTPVHRMLDEAILWALEQGLDGFDCKEYE